jgi:hypothetical protein
MYKFLFLFFMIQAQRIGVGAGVASVFFTRAAPESLVI